MVSLLSDSTDSVDAVPEGTFIVPDLTPAITASDDEEDEDDDGGNSNITEAAAFSVAPPAAAASLEDDEPMTPAPMMPSPAKNNKAVKEIKCKSCDFTSPKLHLVGMHARTAHG